MRKLLYVCAPWQTRTPGEEALTREAVLTALRMGWAPVFVPFLYGDIDHDPQDRKHALAACHSFILKCDSFLIVGDRVTEGMHHDLKVWELENEYRGLYKWPQFPRFST